MSPSRKTVAPAGVEQIATIRIELLGADPPIWREVEAPVSITLLALHEIVQAAMGWLDEHLWEFTIDKKRFGLPMDEDWGTAPLANAVKVRLGEVLRPRGTKIDYLYDFGDGWEHRLTVTRVRAGDPDTLYPRYVRGERNGPPEDCGGLPGFYQMIETLADPKHPDHAHIKEWADGYDPDAYDEATIREALAQIATSLNAAKARRRKKGPGGPTSEGAP